MRKCSKCGEPDTKVRIRPDRADCTVCENKARRERRARKKALAPQPEPVEFKEKIPHAQTYVVTYAQNATPVHKGFLASLKQYCKHNNAQLVVIPGKYNNPTSLHAKQAGHHDWWEPELKEYLCVGRKDVGGMIIYGDISIQPTATRPLTGFEIFAGKSSALFGHPRLQLRTVATADIMAAKILSTTGAVTVANYTDSKAGKKAAAHHVMGAAIVQRKGKKFHLRQINATDDGSFIDLDKEYTPDKVKKAPRALALVCGDIHVEKSDKKVLDATFYKDDSIVKAVRPERILLHDTLDFNVRNHHEIHNFNIRLQRSAGLRKDLVHTEVEEARDFVSKVAGMCDEAVVVPSNHDEALDRWLAEADIKKDPLNARFYHYMWLMRLNEFQDTGALPPSFECFFRNTAKTENVRFLRRHEQFQVAEIECSFHGDKGTNGTRGSIHSYAKLGVKTITGHSHSPEIMDGAYAVGVTGALRQGYNESCPSTWAHAHVIVYGNGKRSLVFISPTGEWRG